MTNFNSLLQIMSGDKKLIESTAVSLLDRFEDEPILILSPSTNVRRQKVDRGYRVSLRQVDSG